MGRKKKIAIATEAAEMDRRHIAGEIRIDVPVSEQKPTKLSGLAAPYYDGTSRTEYVLAPGVVERYMPGAFADAVAGLNDVRALFNHDDAHILGRTKSGTLRLQDTSEGLFYEIDLGETTVAHDVALHVERGDISGSSISFQVVEERIVQPVQGSTTSQPVVRELAKLKLYDVSPVTYPAYEGTTVSARSADLVAAAVEAVEVLAIGEQMTIDRELMAQAEADLDILGVDE